MNTPVTIDAVAVLAGIRIDFQRRLDGEDALTRTRYEVKERIAALDSAINTLATLRDAPPYSPAVEKAIAVLSRKLLFAEGVAEAMVDGDPECSEDFKRDAEVYRTAIAALRGNEPHGDDEAWLDALDDACLNNEGRRVSWIGYTMQDRLNVIRKFRAAVSALPVTSPVCQATEARKTILSDSRNFRPVAYEYQFDGGRVVLSYQKDDERLPGAHRIRPLLYIDTIEAVNHGK